MIQVIPPAIPFKASEPNGYSPVLRFLSAGNRKRFSWLGEGQVGKEVTYVFFFRVHNLYELDLFAITHETSSTSPSIPPAVVADLTRGRCVLILDCCNE